MEPIESETTGAYPVVAFDLVFTCSQPAEAEAPGP
jgi:hypothetical protein